MLLNMQSVHLRDLPHDGLLEPIPGFVDRLGQDDVSAAAARFMYQNGFETVHEEDFGGWFPLHYAALRGDPLVIQGLLSLRADPDCQTRKEQSLSGTVLWTTALAICVFHKHNKAASVLISAKAELHLGLTPALHVASHANNPEAIRMLLQAGFQPGTRDGWGVSALMVGCLFGSLAAVEELCEQAPTSVQPWDLSEGLIFSGMFYGVSADFVRRLVERQADVNHQRRRPLLPTSLLEVLEAQGALQYRLGKKGVWATYCYHVNGLTPLMAAVLSGQHESAAALIAAGARLDITNSRSWAAAEFGHGQSPSEFLQQAFQGRTEGCRRVAALATGYVSENF